METVEAAAPGSVELAGKNPMTEAPQTTDISRAVALAQTAVRAKHLNRAAIAISPDDTLALAQAVLSLDDMAKHAAGLLLWREDYRSEAAADARDVAAEMFNDACDTIAKKLAALGYVQLQIVEHINGPAA